MFARRFALAAALLVFAGSADAKDYKLGDLEIANPWSRATPATAPTAGGFQTITNKGTTPDRLVAVKAASAADKAEVHEMKMDGAIMRMREVEKGLEIAPGATVELKPNGFHLMFIGLKAPFTKGMQVPVTLVFEKAGSIDVDLAVAALGAAGPAKN